MYHIAICDDENLFVDQLQNDIDRYAKEIGTDIRVTIYSDGAKLLQRYSMDIDLIFLDIQMEHLDGLQTADAIRAMDGRVSIIFLTSMAQYALEGYKYNATNFIIKPIQYVRLKDELDKWRAAYRLEEQEHILISNDTGKYKVFLNNLQYIETFGRNLMVHTDKENIIAYRKLKKFEAELPATSFMRCHASYLVNLFYVKRVVKLDIELTNGERIPISQPKRKIVMEKLAEYWGERL